MSDEIPTRAPPSGGASESAPRAQSLVVPKLSLVLLVGASGSGKSTFAKRCFLPTEVLSSDHYRGVVADDEGDQAASADAFEVVRFIAKKRLAAGRLVVIDATNVQAAARAPFVQLAREENVLPVAIVLDLPEKVCHARNADRADRAFGPHVVRNQIRDLRRSIRELSREGFRYVHVLSSEAEALSATIVRQPLWTDRRDISGPFDIIGDVHGCYDELVELLEALGYGISGAPSEITVVPPEGRKAVFLGDLVDRGPRSPDVLRLVMSMSRSGAALVVPGNHDVKLLKVLRGRDVKIAHGLERTLEQLATETPAFKEEVASFIDGLVSHMVLDRGKLVVAHAGIKQRYQGRASSTVRDFCLYGETTGETDSYGLPVRFPWAAEYRGSATVVYGHTPTTVPEWENNTICIDTGCVFGGALTALRYPEREIVDVKARAVYYEPAKPLAAHESAGSQEERPEGVLDIGDVSGRRAVRTRLTGMVTIRDENAAAALEVMSRFAVDPRWLVTLPPTMSPSETAKEGPCLEHPAQAFAYYRANRVGRVMCEEKHMGSRAILVVCRDDASRNKHFRMPSGPAGTCYTRTGRPFFNDGALLEALLDRTRNALDRAGLWEELASDWVVLDAEILPWSAKAQDLLKTQYAATGAAGRASLSEAHALAVKAALRDPSAAPLAARLEQRAAAMDAYVEAYRAYSWPVRSLDDYKVAPFQLLAAEGVVYAERDHGFHMRWLHRLCDADPALFRATEHRAVDLSDPAAEAAATAWWSELVERGGEGMVVKSWEGAVRGPRGHVQPAVKCRGPKYLRLIYGPEYRLPENLERLRARGLSAKRSLALREHALGLEALCRFVAKEPLYRVHECVFGVLALESEPLDPRL